MTAVRRPSAARTRLAAALLPTLLAGALLAGCGNDDSDDSKSQEETVETSPSDSPTEGSRTETPDDTTVPGKDSPVVQDSVADLAKRKNVDEAEIEVVAVEAVTWNDGSIGCAKPGMMYTQATVEGQRITLRIGDKDFAYHAAGDKKASFCRKPTQ